MFSLFGYIQEPEFVTGSTPGSTDACCRLATSIRFRDNIIRSSAVPKQTITCLLQTQPAIHSRRPSSHQLVPCFILNLFFYHQKGSTIMTKLTYTLAIINGTVCYECQPSTPHAFYSGGGWFAPFCTVLELTRKNTVKA